MNTAALLCFLLLCQQWSEPVQIRSLSAAPSSAVQRSSSPCRGFADENPNLPKLSWLQVWTGRHSTPHSDL